MAEKSLALKFRIPRKAIPNGGCAKVWWYLNQNGDITIYGTRPPFGCIIPARSLKVLTKRPSR